LLASGNRSQAVWPLAETVTHTLGFHAYAYMAVSSAVGRGRRAALVGRGMKCALRKPGRAVGRLQGHAPLRTHGRAVLLEEERQGTGLSELSQGW